MALKVLIAAPSYEGKLYCLPQYIDAINYLDKKGLDVSYLLLDNGKKPFDSLSLDIPYDIIRLFGSTRRLNSREVLAYCYSVILCYAEGYRFDYLLFLESDVIMPSDGLHQLIVISKRLGGKERLAVPVVYKADSQQVQIYKPDLDLYGEKRRAEDGSILPAVHRTPYKLDEIPSYPFQVESATFSALLIPARFFFQLRIDWRIDYYNHSDVRFYDLARRMGIEVWYNPKVKCLHLQRPFDKEVPW